MKRLNATGKYIEKWQAQVITASDEDYLWSLRLPTKVDRNVEGPVGIEISDLFQL